MVSDPKDKYKGTMKKRQNGPKLVREGKEEKYTGKI
jgi:hypothetical protein